MKIFLYAMLKDYFDHEVWMQEPVRTVEELKVRLLLQNENARDLLDNCRFAVNDRFIDNNYIFQSHDVISILPPASGG
jgi:molybdopterin synthase sulfur carrier subunit